MVWVVRGRQKCEVLFFMMRLTERDCEMLQWLVHMKFMLLEQIAKAFFKGRNPHRSPYRRVLRLMKEGLIAKKKVYIEPKDLYVPTKKAVSLLRSKGFTYVLDIPRNDTIAFYGHDKTLTDLRIFFKHRGILSFIPERVIRAIKQGGACPDALIVTSNGNYAIEYEHTEKRLMRYKAILKRYSEREKYMNVIYVVQSQSFIDRVMKTCHPSKNVYFITKESLFRLKGDAKFQSSCGNKHLLIMEMKETCMGEKLSDYTAEFLEEIIKPLPDDSWQAQKPYFRPGGGGGGRKKKQYEQDDYGQEEENTEGDYYPKIYPSIYPSDGHDPCDD